MTQTKKPTDRLEIKHIGRLSKIVQILVWILCLTSGLTTAGLWYTYWQYTENNIRTAKVNAQGEAARAVDEIDLRLRQLSDTATSIAKDLSEGKLKEQDLIPRLKSITQTYPYFFGVGAAYQPYAYQPRRQLYSPYFFRKDGEYTFTEQLPYDYTKKSPQTEWYHRSLEKGGNWLEPFYGQAVKQMLVLFGTPFYHTTYDIAKKPIGIIFANYSLDDLKQLMNSLKLGESGYGFIISKEGAVIVHPIKEYTIKRKTILDIAHEFKAPELEQLTQKAKESKRGSLEATSKTNGKSFWLFYEPIPSTGWTMVTIFFKDEITIDSKWERQLTDGIAISLIVFLFFLSCLVFRCHTGNTNYLWAIVHCTNILAIAGIAYKWQVALTERPYLRNTKEKLVLTSVAATNQFLNTYTEQSFKSNQGQPIFIPTGVMVQTMEFINSNNVAVTGYIWQKYIQGIHDNVKQGITLPEAVSSEITEAYRRRQGDQEVVGWYFVATLRQNFDYERYPFDYKDVWIRMWAADFDKNVVLVPDFEAYDLINPDTMPGTEKDFVLSGWEFDSSFFEYYMNSYNTNFGISSYVGQSSFPELYFTIVIRRSLLPLLINNFFPILVVAIFVFCLMLLTKDSKKEENLTGFDGTQAIALSSGLMFLIILNQISLRESITAMGVIYIEYFYFVLYFMILLVICDAFLYMLEGHLKTLEARDNLMPRLLYWPVFFGSLLIITFAVF